MNPAPTLREQLERSLEGVYRIERELTAGGMSRVFLATELRFERQVVLKVLSPDLAAGVNVDRFRREVSLAARLQQANIVPVLDAGEVGGLPYYTMPWVEGESLAARLESGTPLPTRDAISILQDVLRALQYAHAQGVVHRDIKPGNILLSGRTAVVTDFGIAKALSASRTIAPFETLTHIGTSLGTPAYMAPEQAMGDPNTDHRADLYALGVVAYELLAGERPFLGTSPQELVRAHLMQTPQPIGERVPGLPGPVAGLVMRLLAKEPADRPASAEECLQILSGSVTATAPTPAARPRRPWGPVAAIGVLVGLGVAGVLVTRPFREQPAAAEGLLDPAKVRVELPAAGGTDATLAWNTTRRLLSDVPEVTVVDSGAGTVVAFSVASSGPDTLRIEFQVQSAASGSLLKSLRPVRVARAAEDGAWSAALDGLRATVAMIASPMLGPSTLPLGDPPRYAALRELLTGLQVGTRGDSASALEMGRRLHLAANLDTAFLQARLWRAAANTDRASLSYQLPVLLALRDTVRELDRLRERMTPFEAALLAWLQATANANQADRLEALRQMRDIAPEAFLARTLPSVLLDLNRPREALALLQAEGPVRDANGRLIAPEQNPVRWSRISDIEHYLGNLPAARAAAERARQLDPSNLTRLRYSLRVAAAMGDSTAVEDLLAAARSVPNDFESFGYWGDVALETGQELQAHGHPAFGEAVVRRALAWFEDRQPEERTFYVRFRHAITFYELGEYASARAVMDPMPANVEILSTGLLARIAAAAGDTATATRLDGRLEAMGIYRLGANTLERAFLAAQRGDRDRAVTLLQEAFAQGQGFSIRWRLHWLTDTRPLRGYPPFDRLITPDG
jgi:tetratricopeptide (TPR) repeat protein